MPNVITIRGAEGKLYWGYLLAGTFRDWTAVRASPADQGTLTASIVSVDTFRLSQRPLVFVVQHKHGSWRWPLTSLQNVDGMITASLGPQEEAHVQPHAPA